LTTPDPGSYARPAVPTFTGPALGGLRPWSVPGRPSASWHRSAPGSSRDHAGAPGQSPRAPASAASMPLW